MYWRWQDLPEPIDMVPGALRTVDGFRTESKCSPHDRQHLHEGIGQQNLCVNLATGLGMGVTTKYHGHVNRVRFERDEGFRSE